MTDENAVALANLLAEYSGTSVKEGASVAEVASWTVASVVSDIIDTTPQDLQGQIHTGAYELAEHLS